MTTVTTDLTEHVEPLTEAAARKLIDSIKGHVFSAWTEIIAAYERRAWEPLGYESWDTMCDAEFQGARIPLPREERREIVGSLRDAGMTLRDVAATIGTSHQTVLRDERSGPNGPSPLPTKPAEPPPPGSDGTAIGHVDEAIERYPELEHYRSQPRRAVDIADALDGYSETERPTRVDNLRKSIAAEQRRAEHPPAEPPPNYRGMADAMFRAINAAAQSIDRNGGTATIAKAVETAPDIETELWRDSYKRLASTLTDLATATRPTLRSIK